VGTFFSEMGRQLLKMMIAFDHKSEELKNALNDKTWSDTFVNHAIRQIKSHPFQLDLKLGDIDELKAFLLEKRPCLMRMLENPNLLEHEAFTDLLWATSHLTEELALRKNLHQLHPPDGEHLVIDLKRAFYHLFIEWTAYMKHLKRDYPYIFSLALRNNPFEKDPKIEFE
jgi:hypothetical protein